MIHSPARSNANDVNHTIVGVAAGDQGKHMVNSFA